MQVHGLGAFFGMMIDSCIRLKQTPMPDETVEEPVKAGQVFTIENGYQTAN